MQRESHVVVLKKYSIEEILNILREHRNKKTVNITLREYKVNIRKNPKFRLFLTKPLVCQCCGISANKFCLEINLKHEHKHKAELHLYGIDKNGNDVQFTTDHIIPISKGGDKYNLKNLQLMCFDCNNKKGCQLPENIKTPKLLTVLEFLFNRFGIKVLKWRHMVNLVEQNSFKHRWNIIRRNKKVVIIPKLNKIGIVYSMEQGKRKFKGHTPIFISPIHHLFFLLTGYCLYKKPKDV
jgi:5-methylcytosine-specific restriction endonuclease McrA